MSKITDILKQVYEPFCAIIAYKADKGVSSEEMFYLEQHSILKDGSMGAGKPMKKETIVKLVSTLSKSNKQIDSSIYGVVPENVLYCDTRMGHEKLVWYHKPEERFLFFSEKLEIPNGKMIVPGLVYVVSDKTLSMYAFKGNKPKRQLFAAPFMNTDTDHVCLGNSKIKYPEERTFENIIAYWEDMFWKSEFSHILGTNPCLGNLSTITKECISKGTPFPQDELKPISKTLNDLLK
ncbi:MAG: PRTRC system protein B [Prevotella sp.]